MIVITFLKKIFNFFKPESRSECIDRYLSQSVDLADLERRIRILDKKLGLRV